MYINNLKNSVKTVFIFACSPFYFLHILFSCLLNVINISMFFSWILFLFLHDKLAPFWVKGEVTALLWFIGFVFSPALAPLLYCALSYTFLAIVFVTELPYRFVKNHVMKKKMERKNGEEEQYDQDDYSDYARYGHDWNYQYYYDHRGFSKDKSNDQTSESKKERGHTQSSLDKKLDEALKVFGYHSMSEVNERDLKKRYIQMAKKYHPDVDIKFAEKFKKINVCHDLLMKHLPS